MSKRKPTFVIESHGIHVRGYLRGKQWWLDIWSGPKDNRTRKRANAQTTIKSEAQTNREGD
jgi:hypothetical protein